ncbi:MAG: T9SS type A sorting domain-containing protein [Saprospiraceae bacterium]|nr:T9SS type A sorting domain-containing protein [Saprospiraceae bacterium]
MKIIDMGLAVRHTFILRFRIVFLLSLICWSYASQAINNGDSEESIFRFFFEEPVIGFTGVLAPAQWTLATNGGDGYANINNAPASIAVYGSDNQSGATNYTMYCINIPGTHSGILKFQWNYMTFDTDGPQYDPFGISINGTNSQLTTNNGNDSQSGNYQYLAQAGDLFCFYVYSLDQRFGRAMVTLSNFSYSPQIFTTVTNSGTYIVPQNVNEITVRAWGGGGGGATTNSTGKGAGGGGAFASRTFSVTPGTYNITIGNGGGPGVAGGLTQFGTGTQVLARGGSAGNNNNGGTGGLASTSVGAIRFSGGAGGNGHNSGNNRAGGGGGGSAFETVNGNAGTNGANNSPGTGGTGSGNGGNGGTPSGNGQSGFVPGGGGGGGGRFGTSGSGARGQMIINHNFPLIPDPNQCTIVAANSSIPADGLSSTLITVQAKTSSGTNIPFGGATVTLNTTLGSLSSVTDNTNGTYTALLSTGITPGTAVITGTINAQNILATAEVEFTYVSEPVVVVFSTPGAHSWVIPSGVTEVDVLIVGGGGGGGTSTAFANAGSGGGGAGGYIYLQDYDITSLSSPVSIVVGNGGNPGVAGNNSGSNGSNSSFATLIGLGGGGGIGGNGSGNAGGSGGGSRDAAGGNGTQPASSSGGQGNNGGTSGGSPAGAAASGGGGAGGAGENRSGIIGEAGGNGGLGLQNDISGTPLFYAGGGGAGAAQTTTPVGIGGSGVGGNGANNNIAATSGLNGTGSGGGGGNNNRQGAAGGSGIVIIRYATGAALEATISSGTSWYMISSPSPSITYEDLLDNFITQGFSGSTYPDRQPNLLWFDETDTLTSNMSWRTISSIGNNVTSGRGYFLYVFGDIAADPLYNLALPRNLSIPTNSLFSGTSFAYNQSTFPVTYTPRTGTQDPSGPLGNEFFETNIADLGWNLLGNPTGESLNWGASSGWTKTNLDNSIYIWDPVDSEFKVFNGVTGSHNGHIAPFKSFWIRANASNPALSFTDQVFTDDGIFQRNGNPDHITLPIQLKNTSLQAQAFVSFMEDAEKLADAWDAYMLEPLSDRWLTMFTCPSQFDKIPLSINALPVKKADEFINIPLYINGIDNGESIHGVFSLNWTLPENWPEEWTIELHDHLRSKAISMKDNQRYEFYFKTELDAQETPGGSNVMKELPTKMVHYSLPEDLLSSRDQNQPFSIIIHKNGHVGDPLYLSKEMKLINTYPNPFSDFTKIQIEMPEPGFVDLELYDISGRLMDFKKQIGLDGGRQTLEYHPNNLKAGLYVLHIKSVFGNGQLKLLYNK